MKAVRVYRFGLASPIEGGDEVRRQMRLAHEYRNKLVEIERARRAELRQAISGYGDIAALEAAVATADAALMAIVKKQKAARARDRSFKADAAFKGELSAARAAKREAVVKLREARSAIRGSAELSASKSEIEFRYAEKRRQARAACGVYWGTYLLIESADEAARKAPLYDGAEPNDPKFVRWTGEGMIGVQVQGGALLRDAHRLLAIDLAMPPPGADPRSKRSARRQYVTLAFRIGSTERKEPVWARFPMVQHRPVPDDAIVKMATVSLRRIGPREEWSVNITVELPVAAQRRCEDTDSKVAVDIGWRLVDGGLRVAAWRGSDGDHGFLVLPQGDVHARLRKVEDLRSIRDKSFNAARDALSLALSRTTVELPEWMKQETRTLGQWRSAGRLAALIKRWRSRRFEGDAEMYGAAEAWRYQDHHLWEWQTSLHAKTLRHRRDVYRTFAARLAKRYGRLIVEDFDLRDVARRSQGEGENETARYSRQVASTSELRLALVNAFRGYHDSVPAQNTTKTCHACGSVEEWDQAADVVHTCASCGTTWDQDDNAARNLLTASERPGDDGNAGPSRKGENVNEPATKREGRWARVKRTKTEEAALERVARAPDKDAAE